MSILHEASLPLLEIDGKVATITLRKPEFANRLGVDDLNLIAQYVEKVNQEESVMVLRLIAQGTYFCSGFDLKALGGDDSPSSLIFGHTVDILEKARPITIAAIQGGLYGGGSDLGLACDFRIGTPATNMFIPAAKLGLHFYPGGLRRYVERIGVTKAKEVFLLAKHFDADELFNMGFLTHLVPQEELEQFVENLTRNITAMAPLAMMTVKKHLNLIASQDVRVEEITQLVRLSEQSEDIREGVLAWKEKRAPIFNGR